MLTEKEYTDKKGLICPNCLGTHVNTSGPAEVYDAGGVQMCGCGTCHAEWDDIYKLEGYANLVAPVNK